MFWRKRKEQYAGPSSGAPLSGGFSLGVAEGVAEGGAGALKQSASMPGGVANSDRSPGAFSLASAREGGLSASGNSASERPAYVLPKGYRVNGMLFVSGDVRIDGELSGRGVVAHKVEIAGTGRVRCPVEASVILVEGLAQGALRARDLLEIRAGGEVRGDVEAASLRVFAGAILSDARCTVGK
jgi:cytoskeletal protein CcmA (bactofilin family)